jgi:ferredoxin
MPTRVIFYEDTFPAEWREFIPLNAEMAKQLPNITTMNAPLV